MATTSLFILNSVSPSPFFQKKKNLSSKSYLHENPTAIPFACSSNYFSTKKLHYFAASKTSSIRSNTFHKRLAPPVKGVGSSTLQSIEDEAPSAAAIVDTFYSAINRKNVTLLSNLLAEDCTLHCMFFFQPFRGKYKVMMFLRDLMDSMDSQMQFVMHETTEGTPHKVGKMWHLEQKKEKFYLGRGCSFHICKSYHGKLLITDIQVFTDLPIKLDILAYAFVKVLRKVIKAFPFLPAQMQKLENPQFQFLYGLVFSLLVLCNLLGIL